MKKTILKICLFFTFYFTVINGFSWDFKTAVDNREKVDLLIKQAFDINEGFVKVVVNKDTPTKLEQISFKLKQATDLAPNRSDIQISLANSLILQNKLPQALNYFQVVNNNFNNSIEALNYLTIWNHYLGNKSYQSYFKTLKQKDPSVAKDLKQSLAIIKQAKKLKLIDKPFKLKGENPAIVVLGAGLADDGNMKEVLINRLKQALAAFKLNPNSLIIVTGGAPKNRITEAINMKKWLIENNIDAKKIITENYAKNTVENAIYSLPIIAERNIDQVLLVSSATHMSRVFTLFRIAAKEYSYKVKFNNLVYLNEPLDKIDNSSKTHLYSIYRDSLRTRGYFLFNSPPFVVR